MKFGFIFLGAFANFFASSAHVLSFQHTTGKKILVEGKVMEHATNEPISARVTLEAEGQQPVELFTDDNGKFSTALPSTTKLVVIASASGFDLQEDEWNLPAHKSDTTLSLSIALKPSTKMRLTGTILDQKTMKPIEAEFDMFLDNDMVASDARKVDKGKYEETITNYGWYLINVSSPGYLTKTDTIWVVNDNRPEVHRDFFLTPIEEGLTVTLKNIQFEFAKTTLSPESFEELGYVVKLLADNPNLKLEIGGHTDSEGPDDYNLYLSQGRAQSVVDYLISQGIPSKQLVAKGYGETKPVDTRETRQAKTLNRRVEFTVLKN